MQKATTKSSRKLFRMNMSSLYLRKVSHFSVPNGKVRHFTPVFADFQQLLQMYLQESETAAAECINRAVPKAAGIF